MSNDPFSNLPPRAPSFGPVSPDKGEGNPYSVGYRAGNAGFPSGNVQNPAMGNVAQAYPVYAVDNSQIGDGTGGLIPYKNPQALVAYYLGIVSMLPLLGFPFGIISIVLGIKGLKARKANPIIKGSVHAWIGIVLGLLFMPVHLLIVAGIVAAIVS